jgi:hypothetical protein
VGWTIEAMQFGRLPIGTAEESVLSVGQKNTVSMPTNWGLAHPTRQLPPAGTTTHDDVK